MKTHYYLLLISFLIFSGCKDSGTNTDDDTDDTGFNETGFFKAQGTQILNRQGEPVVIKGFGLGGWLLPEGYMFGLNRGGYTSASDIQRNATDLIGVADAEAWIQLFRDNYVQEKDIILMKEWGADHIRIPFHYNLFYNIEQSKFVEEGFDRIDDVLIWCKRKRMDVILDMHAAPGAQNSGDISDSDGVARLWTENEKYGPITILIWEEIARRYKDENIIIGYDLINEPVTPDGYGAIELAKMYDELAKAIRKIDTNHILFIEGNYYATTFDLLFPPFDDNMVYAFHKYWNETDQGTIQYLLNIRSTYQVPLWLGESGENSNPWFRETIDLVERNNVGWNWWTHKKLETITSPLSIPTNPNYEKVKNYWNGSGPRPTAAEAKDGLFKMANDIDLDNTILRQDVVDALFSPIFTTANKPYKELNIPGNIEAVHFDIGMNTISYYDKEYKRVSSDAIQNTGNSGWEFRNDGVDIQTSEDPLSTYNIGWFDTVEWLEYTVKVTAGTYEIRARVASGASNGKIAMQLDDVSIGNTVTIQNTGGYQNWSQVSLGTHTFPAGEHILKVQAIQGGFNFSLIIIN